MRLVVVLFHPEISLVEIMRAAENMDCTLKGDQAGRLVIVPNQLRDEPADAGQQLELLDTDSELVEVHVESVDALKKVLPVDELEELDNVIPFDPTNYAR